MERERRGWEGGLTMIVVLQLISLLIMERISEQRRKNSKQRRLN
ncbi:hypothetical protein CsSME_00020656 [Camellia sinensis var. sinensis]